MNDYMICGLIGKICNRNIGGILVVISLCVLLITGCGKSITERYDENGNNGIKNVEEYGVLQLAFDTGDTIINSNTYCYKDGKLYYAANGGINENNECLFYIHRYDIADEKDSIVIKLGTKDTGEDKPVKTLWGISAADNGDITVYAEYRIPGEDMDMSYGIIRLTYDSSGNEIARDTLEQPEGMEDVDMLDPYNSKCYGGMDGSTYSMVGIGGGYYHVLYDKEGKISGMVRTDLEFNWGVQDSEGNIVVLADTENGNRLGYVDYAGRRIDTKPFAELNDKELSVKLMGASGRELYLADAKYLYVYEQDNKQLSRLLSFLQCGLDINDIDYICRLDEDRLLCAGKISNGTELLILDKSLETEKKETVKIAGMSGDDGELRAAVSEYNRGRHEYFIEFKDYGNIGIEGMMKDIMTGDAPDIYLLEWMDTDSLIAGGFLEDLMPYMEKDDVLNKDYFIDGFLGKTENDGRQYVLMRRFFISAMLCGSEAGEFVEASSARNIMPGLIKKYEDMPQGTVLVSGISGVDMYDVIMSGCVSDFMDYNDGTCSFNSGDYSQILEFCRKIEEEYAAGADVEENLSKDRALLTNRYIYGINDIQYDDVICGGGSCYVGYPAKENVYMKCAGSTFGMSALSEKKEAAWCIIKELMTGSYRRYKHVADEGGIPVSRTEFDMMIKEASATEEYTAEDGATIYPQYVVMPDNISYGPATEKDIDILKKLIDCAVYNRDNKQAVDVTKDVAEQYIKGMKNLEDAINIIQDKAVKYVNENR